MSFAANAYARTARSALSPREAEAAVLIKAARQLEMVRDDWTNESANLGKALTFNQKVWTLLATDATESTSPLPGEVKQGVAPMRLPCGPAHGVVTGRGAVHAYHDADHRILPGGALSSRASPRRRPGGRAGWTGASRPKDPRG